MFGVVLADEVREKIVLKSFGYLTITSLVAMGPSKFDFRSQFAKSRLSCFACFLFLHKMSPPIENKRQLLLKNYTKITLNIDLHGRQPPRHAFCFPSIPAALSNKIEAGGVFKMKVKLLSE